MSEDQSSADKTEEPTSYRLSKAREKGQVIRSMEVNTALVLLAGGLGLLLLAPVIWGRLGRLYHHLVWRRADWRPLADLRPPDLLELGLTVAREFLIIILPLALAVMAAGLFGNLTQTGGFLFSAESLRPKLSKINPLNGLKRMFSLRSVVECLKSVFKILIIGGISAQVITSHLPDFAVMGDMEPAQSALEAMWIAFELFMKVCLVLGVMAVFDYGYQRWQFMKDMRMTKQEVKEEFKQLEGDPIVKSRIRQVQREAAKKRMLADVPKADVVIANPTHLALALKYDPGRNPAPVVVAKGRGFLAQRIKDIARENKVPIMENKPLAQALYKAVQIGETIPVEFYRAVAEVLGYVYRLKGRRPHARKSR